MSRLHSLFTVVLPSMLAGGVLFGSAFGRADAGRTLGEWPSSDATVVAQAEPHQHHRAPMPPMPPMPPAPPVPPVPMGDGGINVTINGNHIQIEGIRSMIEAHIESALQAVRSAKGLPPEVREKIVKRIEKVRKQLQKRLAHVDVQDMDQLGEELGKLGDELGKEMDEFGKEMEKAGDQWGKDFGKKYAKQFDFAQKWDFHGGARADSDNDGDDDITAGSDVDDQEDVDDVAVDLGDLSLDDGQRATIQALRKASDAQVATAKRALDQASADLQQKLGNPNTSDADISRAIDVVTQQEAAIRKARILAWHHARRELSVAQRHKIEDAAHAKHPK